MRFAVMVTCVLWAARASAQPGSPKCLAAQKAVAAQQQRIKDYQATKNDPRYAGSAITIYMQGLKQLQNQLAGFQAAAQILCSAEAAAALEGDVKPRFLVLSVIYAPPGTAGGRGSSSVDYAHGSSTGTTLSVGKTFKKDNSVTASVSVGSDSGAGASVSLGLDWAETVADKTEVSIKKTDKNDIKVSAPGADGINHDEDRIYVWLNPIVHVEIRGKKIVYTVGVDGPTMDAIYVYPPWLKNPQLFASSAPDIAKRFAARGITPDDLAQMLAADPFATGSTAIDTHRFIPMATTFPYEPPLQASDGGTVESYTVTWDQTSTETTSTESSFSIDLKVSVSGGFPGVMKVSLSNEDKWTWTQSNSAASSVGTTESATVAVGNPSVGYTGPEDIAVYWDSLFHTFLFAPVAYPTPGNADRGAFATGTITDPTGKAVVGKEVTLTSGGRLYRTFTDQRGVYRFFALPGKTHTGVATLKVGAMTKNLSIGAKAAHTDLKVDPKIFVKPVHPPVH